MFELGIQKNWIDALYARSSVRQYTGAPDKEQLDRLGEDLPQAQLAGRENPDVQGPRPQEPDQGHGRLRGDRRQSAARPWRLKATWARRWCWRPRPWGWAPAGSARASTGYHQPQRRFADG